MATTQEAEEAPRSSSSSPLRQMKQRVPGHVPPEYNYAGFDLPRATPDQLDEKISTVENTPLPQHWVGNPAHATKTALDSKRRQEEKPSSTYDIDGDGSPTAAPASSPSPSLHVTT